MTDISKVERLIGISMTKTKMSALWKEQDISNVEARIAISEPWRENRHQHHGENDRQ